MDAPWRIQLLGALRAVQGERVLTRFRTHKTGILLAHLSYYPQRTPSREELIEILWPGRDLPTGRNNLRVALSSLRRQLEPPGTPPGAVLEAHGATVQLNPRAYTTDVGQFENALQAAGRAGSEIERMQRLTEAIEQYQGELLPGFLDAWILPERQRLLEACLQSLRQLATLLERAGDLPGAVHWARRAVFADPLREESQSELIRLFAAAREPQSALRQYRELKELLAREIGVSPSAATQAIVRAIECQSDDPGEAEGLQTSRSDAPPESPPKSKTAAKPKSSAGVGSVTRPAPSSPSTGSVTFVLIEMTGGSGADPMPGSMTTQRRDAGRFAPDQTLLFPPGHVVKETAESLVLAFAEASDALVAATAAHRALVETPTPPAQPAPHVRMALHTGDVEAGAALHSPALQHGMRLLMAASSGQILLSALTAALLRDELGPEQHLVDRGLYRLRDQDRPERLFQFFEGGAPDPELSFLHAAPAPRGNLPLEFNRFFGREAEIAALAHLLQGEGPGQAPRVVTLTGPGGCGKTRLALAVAAHLRSGAGGEERAGCPRRAAARGCWFVSLQEITDARLILDRVMRALQLPRSPHLEPLEQLVRFFSRTPTLLLLDNFEQLVAEGTAVVRTLIERAPTLTLLVTSRQSLNLACEHEFPVPRLPVPVGSGQWAVDSPAPAAESLLPTTHCPLPTLIECPSVQLFIDRAQMVRPDFQLTPSNAGAVAALCRRLEGLPLAVELAAARVRALTPQQMLDRLSERFTLLASRRWDSEPRHQSLRAALDWSYELLTPELQRFFAWLSIFRGGFTLEAAEAVCGEGVGCLVLGVRASGGLGPTPNTQHQTPILENLDQLQGCSLLLASGENERRVAMLETLREYAAEHLTPADAATLARRHARYYLQLAETAEAELTRPGQSQWLERLEQEHDNLRAALDWCQGTGVRGQGPGVREPDLDSSSSSELTPDPWPLTPAMLGLRLGGALGGFWEARGYLAEGRERLEQLLALPGAEAAAVARGKALRWAGALALARHDLEAARHLLEEGLAISRETGDLLGVAEALGYRGTVHESFDDYEAAQACYEESLAISRRLGSQRLMARALIRLSEVARDHHELPEAIALARQGLDLYQEAGDQRGMAHALVRLALMVHHQEDHPAARALLEQSVAIGRELKDKLNTAWALISLGDVLRCLEEYQAAEAACQESLGLWQELGDEWSVAGTLNSLGVVARHRGDYPRAIALFRESMARYRDLNRQPSTHRSHEGLFVRSAAIGLIGLAGVALGMEQAAHAARSLGAAEALLESVDAHPWPAERFEYERNAAAARAALGETAFAEAWSAGRQTPLEQALAEALSLPADR